MEPGVKSGLLILEAVFDKVTTFNRRETWGLCMCLCMCVCLWWGRVMGGKLSAILLLMQVFWSWSAASWLPAAVIIPHSCVPVTRPAGTCPSFLLSAFWCWQLYWKITCWLLPCFPDTILRASLDFLPTLAHACPDRGLASFQGPSQHILPPCTQPEHPPCGHFYMEPFPSSPGHSSFFIACHVPLTLGLCPPSGSFLSLCYIKIM